MRLLPKNEIFWICHRESAKKSISNLNPLWKIYEKYCPFFQSFLLPVCCKIVYVSVYFTGHVEMMNYFTWIEGIITNATKKSRRNIFFFAAISANAYIVYINANGLCFDVTLPRLRGTLSSFICLCKCSTVLHSGINLATKILYSSFSVDWSKWTR